MIGGIDVAFIHSPDRELTDWCTVLLDLPQAQDAAGRQPISLGA